MAPKPIYEKCQAQLLALLADARRQNVPFEEAWAEAVRPGKPMVMTNSRTKPAGALVLPSDREARRIELHALTDPAVREAWRRGYERLPATSSDAALVALLAFLPDLAGFEPKVRVAA